MNMGDVRRTKIEPVRFSFCWISTSTSLQNSIIMSVAGPSTKPVQPFYCGVCTLPTEYCEFGASLSKCKTWLEGKDKAEYDRLWGEGMPYLATKLTCREPECAHGNPERGEAGEDRSRCSQS